MTRAALPRGLYAITDPDYIQPTLLGNVVQRAIVGGAAIIQYRDKSREAGRRKREAALLRDVCHDHGALLVVNDDVRLADEIGADGVHLGRDDHSIESARRTLGEDAIIGASCYDSLARARRARDEGADYVAFGSFFTSPTKPGATRVTIDTLVQAREQIDLHIVAIGGITAQNGARLIQAGADMLAVSAGVFDQRDAEAAARHFAALFRDAEAMR